MFGGTPEQGRVAAESIQHGTRLKSFCMSWDEHGPRQRVVLTPPAQLEYRDPTSDLYLLIYATLVFNNSNSSLLFYAIPIPIY